MCIRHNLLIFFPASVAMGPFTLPSLVLVLLDTLVKLFFTGSGVLFPPNRDYHPQYHRLEEVLAVYQDISSQGGWETLVARKDTLKTGMTDSMVPLLRERLSYENYISPLTTAHPMLFDRETEKALRKFQRNNGLPDTGFPDAATIAALNVPVEKRMEQIRINMDRWKAFPPNPGDHYLFVNVPDFRLDAVKDCDTVLNMKVVVGRTYRKTPEFQAKMTHIIFNPSWQIPPGILHNDIFPKVLEDPSYLRRSNIHVFKTENGNHRREVAADSVDWASLSTKNIPYTLIQSPGPDNPLGTVKFIFPNRYDVYMHDTPLKELFKEPEPTFSSGCIRLAKALDLACHILQEQNGWGWQKVEEAIDNGKSVTVNLVQPVDVYITYFTCWVNDVGQLQFRKDIYSRDTSSQIPRDYREEESVN